MKKKFSTLFALLLPVTLVAQQHISLQEREILIDGNNATAWVFPVAGEIKDALDHLKDYCKERSDVRLKNEGDNLIVAKEVSIPTIATKRGDLIGYGFPVESYNALGIAFRLGYDIYLNSRDWSLEMNNLRNYTKEFISYHYEQTYSDRIKAVEDEIASIEKELGKNEKEIEKLNRDIERTREKIALETDPAKIDEMNAEVTTLTADRERLNNTQPQLRSKAESLRTDVANLKNESLMIQSAISSL
jgi:outer membrane murein-binding lipoprotein Lpp